MNTGLLKKTNVNIISMSTKVKSVPIKVTGGIKSFLFQLAFAVVFKHMSYVKVSETSLAQNYDTASNHLLFRLTNSARAQNTRAY